MFLSRILSLSALLATAQAATLFPSNTSWRYYNQSGNPSAGVWVVPAYNDGTNNGWQEGNAELGFGDNDEATTITNYGKAAYYFRKTFNYAKPADRAVINFSMVRDDGAVVYLNGTEVFRSNMPSGTITSSTLAASSVWGTAESTPVTFSVPISAFNDGSNTIAVEVHQINLTSSDISFSMSAEEGPVIVPLTNPSLSLNPTQLDADSNGLPDVWEGLFNASSLDPNGDEDGDGVLNKDEGLAGTDPRDASDRLYLRIDPQADGSALLCWPVLESRPGQAEESSDLGNTDDWGDRAGSPTIVNGEYQLSVAPGAGANFFRVRGTETDSDGDQVPDWIEAKLGFQTGAGNANSALKARSYDTDGNGSPDTNVSGDLAAFNELYNYSGDSTRPTQAQASRFLLQATFGAANTAELDDVIAKGYEQWIDDQVALPKNYTKDYIAAIRADFNGSAPNSNLAGYLVNSTFIGGENMKTAWMRVAINADDRLRQRVAFALSQIIVASQNAAMLFNQPLSSATYYDNFIDHAFGSYEDLLLKQSLSPFMGIWLSHLGNQKADPSIGRFPDENYAREIMQLFTIGLWELNLDGTRKLDGNGEPIPTYGNYEITEVSKVFTGTSYNANNFGQGWFDDGKSSNNFSTSDMKVFASAHDFTSKQIPMGVDAAGNRLYSTIPARSASDTNALRDVRDVVYQLVRHPNCAPFVCRQLIQFLVTANPTPGYVERVATVFQNDGVGNVGNLEAVVKAILLDEEARNPIENIRTEHFGGLREPLIRLVHIARIGNQQRHNNFIFWQWGFGSTQDNLLQVAMYAPTVFNYYRPDFRLPGEIAARELDSPVFGIVNSFSAISGPNYLWDNINWGFRSHNNQSRTPDYSAFTSLASSDVDGLIDRLSLLLCGQSLSADSRDIIRTAVQQEPNSTNRVKIALYGIMLSPEGSCMK